MTTAVADPAKARNIAIDLAKGICIILMVAGHTGVPKWLGQFIYLFHMPFFFLASGYLFREKNLDNTGKYIKKKFKGLWYPFVFWSIVYLLLHNLFTFFNFYGHSYSLKETGSLLVRYVLTAGTEQLLGGFWFLTSLLFATIVGFLYYKWIGFSTKAIVWGIVIALALAELVCYLGIFKETIHINSRDFTAVAYFLTGTLTARIDEDIMKKYRFPIISTAIVFLALQTTFMPVTISSLTVSTVIPFYITSSCAGIALIQLCYLAPETSFFRAIAKIGTRTIDVLIFHFLIFKLVSLAYVHINGLPLKRLNEFPTVETDSSWLWVVYTVFAVIVSYYIGGGVLNT